MDEARHDGVYRRIEVITGRPQRRNWTDEEKARILAESAEPDVNISAVARRWGVNRGLLNVWRREAGLTIRESLRAAGDVRLRILASLPRRAVVRCRSIKMSSTAIWARLLRILRALGQYRLWATHGEWLRSGSLFPFQ